MDKLTKAEEEVMQQFWSHGPSTVSQLIERLPDPKPPHSTISTFVRILEKKSFLDHKAYGRTFEYFPLVTKESYFKQSITTLVKNYFGGSMKELVSFIAKEENISLKELGEILELENKRENNE